MTKNVSFLDFRSKNDFWRENSNIFVLKINYARYARNIVKWDFLWDFSNTVSSLLVLLAWLKKLSCLLSSFAVSFHI